MKTALFTLLIALICPPYFSADRITGQSFATRSEVLAVNGMVASSHPLATQAGLEILRRGGTAVDAAIAANAVLGLMEPTGCGIGGDLFAIVYESSSGQVFGLNSSGWAPRKQTRELFAQRGLQRIPHHGALAVTVPGCVAGWFALQEKFGRLKMAEILAPAIRYAREGFPLTELIAHYWRRGLTIFRDYHAFQRLYNPWGRLPEKGDIFHNPGLAASYERIARKGKKEFYEGPIAEAIVAAVREGGGVMEAEDLREFRPEWVVPLKADYKGFELLELPPNTQGFATLLMLNMVREFDLSTLRHNGRDYLHLLTEIKKLAYEVLACYCADPGFADIPLERILSRQFARDLLTSYSRDRALREITALPESLREGDTVYLTVVDRDRNVVSLIQSNYSGFGSGVVPEKTGFCLQNRGTLFNLDPNHHNRLEPRKRPFHTIVPAMLLRNGRPVFSFGVMGGDMQPQGHLQVLLNVLEFGMNIQEACDAPRFYHSSSSEATGEKMSDGGILYLESGIPYETVRELVKAGHRVQFNVGGFGGFQGIWIDWERRILAGASESRKDGQAAGY